MCTYVCTCLVTIIHSIEMAATIQGYIHTIQCFQSAVISNRLSAYCRKLVNRLLTVSNQAGITGNHSHFQRLISHMKDLMCYLRNYFHTLGTLKVGSSIHRVKRVGNIKAGVVSCPTHLITSCASLIYSHYYVYGKQHSSPYRFHC